MSDVQIGVVIPSLNGGKTIEWTILSLLRQVGIDIQILVIDSGSEDQTLDICSKRGVRVEYDPPGNLYRAVNKGLRTMSSEWLTYLNSDDVVYSDSYARLIALGEGANADVVYGHTDYVDYFGRFLYSFEAPDPNLLGDLFRIPILGFDQPAAIFRRSAFEELQGFDVNFSSIADLDFFYRAHQCQKRFARLRRPSVAAFRIHNNQFSRISAKLTERQKKLFRRLHPPRHLSLVAFWWWRFSNWRQLTIRYLRTGSLHRH